VTTAAPSVALATVQPAFTDAERVALAGFLAGYRGLTREAYGRPSASSLAGAAAARWPCSPTIAGSASTPSKGNSWIAHPPRTSADRVSTTSPMRSPWAATSSAPS
jgi:hypothetical protein